MTVTYRKGEVGDIIQVTNLLNLYLSYGLANNQSVKEKIIKYDTYVCIKEDEVIGFIASKNIELQDLNLYPDEFKQLNITSIDKCITHLVVEEKYRKFGIGKMLLELILQDIPIEQTIFGAGWIKSNSNKWDAENIFKDFDFKHKMRIANYFSRRLNAPCPYCGEVCKCSAVIVSGKGLKRN